MFDRIPLQPSLACSRCILLLLLLTSLIVPAPAAAECDQPILLRPNVLLVIDNSTSSLNPAPAVLYEPARVYPGAFLPWTIYLQDPQGNFSPKAEVVANYSAALENLTCSPAIVREMLLQNGVYASNGGAELPNLRGGGCSLAPKGDVYALGNYLNYRAAGSLTAQQHLYQLVRDVVAGSRLVANFGAMVIGQKGKGGEVVVPIGDLRADAAFADFLARLPGSGSPLAAKRLNAATALPLTEALVDADAYLRGVQLPISGQAAPAPPATVAAGNNHILLLSTDLPRGESTALLATLVGDADGDAARESSYGQGTAYLDDAAFALYQGPNSVQTSTVLLANELDPLFTAAAVKGHGRRYSAGDAQGIISNLTTLVISICPTEPQPLP